jgi:molecular chaperone GrpE
LEERDTNVQENDGTTIGEKELTEEEISRREDEIKILDLQKELAEVKNELKETRGISDKNIDKLRYMMADFDNYRKQIEKQMISKVEINKAELLLKFLNIYDDFSRAVGMARQSKSDSVVIEGLEGILKNLEHLLKSEGVMEIETVETPFDPNIHDAISFAYHDDLPDNTVIKEIRKGYVLNNKVLRPSLVEISKKIIKNIHNDTEKLEKETEN